MVFPELKDFARGSPTTAAILRLLQAFPSPADLADAAPDELRSALVKACRAPRLAGRADELRTLATQSAGVVTGLDGLLPTERWLIDQVQGPAADLKAIDVTSV